MLRPFTARQGTARTDEAAVARDDRRVPASLYSAAWPPRPQPARRRPPPLGAQRRRQPRILPHIANVFAARKAGRVAGRGAGNAGRRDARQQTLPP